MALKVDAPKRAPKKVSVERNPQGFITGLTSEDDEQEAPAEPWTVAGTLNVRNVGPVQSVPTRTVKVVSTLDGEQTSSQMLNWPAGWSASDVLDELARQATDGLDDGTRWGVPGAARLLLRPVSDTPARLEVAAHGFSTPELADAWQAQETGPSEAQREEIARYVRDYNAKRAEGDRLLAEGEAFNREQDRKLRVRELELERMALTGEIDRVEQARRLRLYKVQLAEAAMAKEATVLGDVARLKRELADLANVIQAAAA